MEGCPNDRLKPHPKYDNLHNDCTIDEGNIRL